jgi:general stress protein 26
MSELRDKIAEGLGTLQLANLSTITEDGKPWTRYVMISGDEKFTLRCATFLQARKVAQIEKNHSGTSRSKKFSVDRMIRIMRWSS